MNGLDPCRTPEQFLQTLYAAAVDSVSATRCVTRFLPPPPKGRTVVIGAGKAAAAMAAAVEAHWTGEFSGMVVTRYGHDVACRVIEVVESSHPVPDETGRDAAVRMLKMVEGLTAEDLVLCLISGGGSALIALPAQGIEFSQKQALNKALLHSGAAINEINCVRKHLSAIKGGRLALACAPAQVVTLMISDIPGDDPTMIASGPTLPDRSTCQDALNILHQYHIEIPDNVLAHLVSGRSETPKPDDQRFAGHVRHVVASGREALEAAAALARSAGVDTYILSDRIEGEARDIGLMHAAIAREIALHDQPFRRPCVLLSGGETTVTVKGKGRGGRNAEFLLSMACALDGLEGIHALACDTDGIDGSEDNAGARLSPTSLARANALGLSPQKLLEENDAYRFFAAIGDLIFTGPTRTNVNDFRAILIC
jgi:glycerate 2-kinase